MNGQVEILLVEDILDDVIMTKRALKKGKVSNNVNVVSNGVEALSYLRREESYADAPRPDLILLDLNMPKKDGREVLAEIKSDDQLKQIPVIVLTTSQAEQDILDAYSLHANCYIAKPVDLGEFMKIIDSLENFWFNIATTPPIE
ncbi:MAG: response regulator [SAR202 cluster bacterium]|jgi:two-component system response regulator|nr:response regulator [Chloroflexota bacterium]MDP6421419.1 response regulator [SAR202 cluster bacterium]HAL46904.1 response regulator [Dehalococcoidia bacterium]MDP6664795.1 response regulator [SAR202 cluster bacterium]MDP6799291.1 response regulator [SAR202 cluster bacterium]|tara:strand:+ start:10652 stop:11086 length:435 start_codon:yes stop_codon:yes gene_type:complete